MPHQHVDAVDCGDQKFGELLDVQQQHLLEWRNKLNIKVYWALEKWAKKQNTCGNAQRFHIVPRGGDLTEFVCNYPNNK